MPNFRRIIRDAYLEILRREPDPAGLEAFNLDMNRRLTEANMRNALLRSQEYAQQNPDRLLRSLLGLNVHLPSLQILDEVALTLGMNWIRVDFVWYLMEPEPGLFDWAATDVLVERAQTLDLGVLAILAYTPPWASSRPSNPAPGDPPASREQWTGFVREVVRRYGSSIRYWQLWNEPNVREFWNGSMKQYRTEILEPGAAVVHEEAPGARVVAPGLATLGSWRDGFREVMNAGDVIDIINHHNYGDTGRETLDELERDVLGQPSVRTLMRQFGVDGRPFWLTETGRRSDEGDQLPFYQELVATLPARSWIERVFFFHYWDGPGAGNGGFGIVNADFSPKPAYLFLQSELQV